MTKTDAKTYTRTAKRSSTYGVNVVEKVDKFKTISHINIFINGVPDRSFEVEGSVDIGSALITVGTQLKLENK